MREDGIRKRTGSMALFLNMTRDVLERCKDLIGVVVAEEIFLLTSKTVLGESL